MVSQDELANQILSEARRICEDEGSGVIITLVATIGDQFVVIFNVSSLSDRAPAERDIAINETALKLQKIKGVARVCYEVLPDRNLSH